MSLHRNLKRLKRDHAGLSPEERDRMTREFSAYLDYHPAHAPGRIAPRALRFPLPRMAASGFAILALLVLASESSLPNESLYGVKTNFTERALRAATYFSPVLRAEADHTVYARRLSEAEQLMLLSQFTAATADEVQLSIDAHATELNRSLERAEASDTDTATGALRAEVTATNEKYDPLIDILELRKRAPDPSVVDDIIRDVTMTYAGTVKPEAVPDVFARIRYEVLRAYAERMLDELEATNKLIAAAVDGEVSATTSELLERANEERAAAERALSAHDPAAALDHLERAQTAANDARSLLST